MIILSLGMPRAGSGWYYNLTNDLMLANGAQDAHQIRKRFHLENILTEVNCNIGALTTRRLLTVLVPALRGNTFVIKAHAGPTAFSRVLIRLGLIKAAYIYRDPRDAMLSALENGLRARQENRQNAFSKLTDFETALQFINDYVLIWDAWMRCKDILTSRYEDLLANYDDEVNRLLNYLPIQVDRETLQPVIERYRPESSRRDEKGMHFSKGKVGRYQQQWNLEELEILQQQLGTYIERMGYT